MAVTISKSFRWEMAHRLADHPGPCQSLHGHSYRAVVEVTGELDATGMVVDYALLRSLATPLLDSLDHAVLVAESDLVVLEFLKQSGMRHQVCSGPPTTEVVARLWLDQLAPELLNRPNVHRVSVTVHETSTATATVSLEVGA